MDRLVSERAMISALFLTVFGVSLIHCLRMSAHVLAQKTGLASDSRRIDTFCYQMEMYELNMQDQFKLRGILDVRGVLTRAKASKIYEARSSKDELWEQKQVLMLMLVRMERLAAGYYLEMFDEDIFYAATGRHFVSTLRRLRFFIDAVQTERPESFAKFVVVANHMEAIATAEEAETTVVPIDRIDGVGGRQ